MDEKSQIQELDRSQPVLPMRSGQPERRTHDYTQHGTVLLFAALGATTGRVIGQCHECHRALEFRRFLDRVDAEVPAGLGVHVVLDNYGTHKTAAIGRWLLRHPHFHFHFTPTGASWHNLIERWFGLLTEQQIHRGMHHSIRELVAAIQAFLAASNERHRPFVWGKTADEILASVARFCRRISDSGHLEAAEKLFAFRAVKNGKRQIAL